MKIPARFDKGRLVIEPVALAIASQEFGAKPLRVTIEAEKPIRTTRANRRYFGCLVPLAGHHLDSHPTREGLPPLSKLQVHGVLVRAFLGEELTALGPTPMETHTLDTKQFHGFTEKVERWLNSLGYQIPAGPEESVAHAIAEATT